MVGGRGGEGLGVDGEGRVPALSLCTSCPGGPGGSPGHGASTAETGMRWSPCDSAREPPSSAPEPGMRAAAKCPQRVGDPESLMIQIDRTPQLMTKPLPRRHTHTLEPQVKAFLCQESSNPPCWQRSQGKGPGMAVSPGSWVGRGARAHPTGLGDQ